MDAMEMRVARTLRAIVGAVLALGAITVGAQARDMRPAGLAGAHTGVAPQSVQAMNPKSYLPVVTTQGAGPSAGEEWSQHGHNAQRTSYTTQVVAAPWRWRWAWNGPNATGGISAGKTGLPRNVQPVTGGGRVYIAAGSRGVYALNETDGGQAWNARPGGNINSTVAFDKDTQSVLVVASTGTLYKLDAASGTVIRQFASGAANDLPLPPAIAAGRVFFAMGNRVFAIDKRSMQQVWAYDAGSPVTTPPAYSPSRNRVIVGAQDLHVHAINNLDGARAWRVRPVDPSLSPTVSPSGNYAEFSYGWPVVAEGAGYVLVKARLDWQTLWTWSPWPTTNAQMRANLAGRPDQQALFVLDLDDGTRPFIAHIGHGGYGDGGYMPMGPQPVVHTLPGGNQVAYVAIRGDTGSNQDGRNDSHFGELMLDNALAGAGFPAGSVRFIQYGESLQGENWSSAGFSFPPTDEQPNLSMAGNQLFAGHWALGLAIQVNDRAPARGTWGTRITSSALPHFVTSTSSGGFSPSHYRPGPFAQEPDSRAVPLGFYIYYGQGNVYDRYWGGYAAWVVSNGNVYFRSNDGAIIALTSGNPVASAEAGVALADVATDGAAASLPADGVAPVADTGLVPHAAARDYAGQVATVEGEIAYIFNNGKHVLWGFAYPHQGEFKIMVAKPNWPSFGPVPEAHLRLGQRVRVTGTITWYQGDPVIAATTPAQITLVSPDSGRSHR